MAWLDHKAVSCKIGTQPFLVELDRRCPMKVGKIIRYRTHERGKWQTALVQRIDPDGYFQADMF